MVVRWCPLDDIQLLFPLVEIQLFPLDDIQLLLLFVVLSFMLVLLLVTRSSGTLSTISFSCKVM